MSDTKNMDGTPLAGPLFSAEMSSNQLRILKDHPNKIIRWTPLGGLNPEAFVRMGKGLFDELQEDYRIRTPGLNMVIGAQPHYDSPALYTIVDRVTGINLENTEQLPVEELDVLVKKVDELCNNLISYIRDKRNRGGNYLNDIFHKDQYMYGTTQNNAQKDIFLVDVEVGYNISTPGEKTAGNDGIAKNIVDLGNMIREFGQELGGRELSAREKFNEFISSISQSDPYYVQYHQIWRTAFRKHVDTKSSSE